MGQTYLDLQNEALSADFNPDTYRAVAKQAIADALSDMARQVDLPGMRGTWTPTITAGVASLTLPSDDLRILSAYDSVNHVPLDEVSQEAIDNAPIGRGRPQAYSVYGTSATLYPTPDQAYTLVFRYAKDISGEADTTDLSVYVPDSYLNAAVSFARHRMFRLEDDAQMSQFWRAEYERDLLRMKADLQRGDRNLIRQIPGPYRALRGSPRFLRP